LNLGKTKSLNSASVGQFEQNEIYQLSKVSNLEIRTTVVARNGNLLARRIVY